MKYLASLIIIWPLASLASAEQTSPLSGSFTSSIRSFGYDPEGNYGSGTLRIETSPLATVYVSGSSGISGSVPSGGKNVLFGGTDIEVGIRYRTGEHGLAGAVGVSFASTYLSSADLTFGLSYGMGSGFSVGVAGFSGSRAVSALQVDKLTHLGGRLSLALSASAAFSGYTTVSANTGRNIRTLLYDAELQYALDDETTLSIGVTDRLGDTTMFSLSSPVGNRSGLVASFGVKF